MRRLVWLVRWHRMLEQTLGRFVRSPSLSTAECLAAGYEASLAKAHGFWTRQAIRSMLQLAPTRAAFEAKLSPLLGAERAEEVCMLLRDVLQYLSPTLERLEQLFANLNLLNSA